MAMKRILKRAKVWCPLDELTWFTGRGFAPPSQISELMLACTDEGVGTKWLYCARVDTPATALCTNRPVLPRKRSRAQTNVVKKPMAPMVYFQETAQSATATAAATVLAITTSIANPTLRSVGTGKGT